MHFRFLVVVGLFFIFVLPLKGVQAHCAEGVVPARPIATLRALNPVTIWALKLIRGQSHHEFSRELRIGPSALSSALLGSKWMSEALESRIRGVVSQQELQRAHKLAVEPSVVRTSPFFRRMSWGRLSIILQYSQLSDADFAEALGFRGGHEIEFFMGTQVNIDPQLAYDLVNWAFVDLDWSHLEADVSTALEEAQRLASLMEVPLNPVTLWAYLEISGSTRSELARRTGSSNTMILNMMQGLAPVSLPFHERFFVGLDLELWQRVWAHARENHRHSVLYERLNGNAMLSHVHPDWGMHQWFRFFGFDLAQWNQANAPPSGKVTIPKLPEPVRLGVTRWCVGLEIEPGDEEGASSP